jgi:hypothetical protein
MDTRSEYVQLIQKVTNLRFYPQKTAQMPVGVTCFQYLNGIRAALFQLQFYYKKPLRHYYSGGIQISFFF